MHHHDPDDATIDLRPDLARVAELLAAGCLTSALERFLALRRRHPGHRQLKMMPLAVRGSGRGSASARPVDERTTESIVLCVPGAGVSGI